MFTRYVVRDGAMMRAANNGDGLAANFRPKVFAAEADATLLASEVSGGLIFQGTTLTSDVVYTLPTAILLAAEAGDMNLGEAASFVVKNSQVGAFDVVIAVGAGITAIGANNTLSVPPQSVGIFTLIMTDDTEGAETFDLY